MSGKWNKWAKVKSAYQPCQSHGSAGSELKTEGRRQMTDRKKHEIRNKFTCTRVTAGASKWPKYKIQNGDCFALLAMTFSYFVVCPFDFAQDRGAYCVLIQRRVDCVGWPDFSTAPSAPFEMIKREIRLHWRNWIPAPSTLLKTGCAGMTSGVASSTLRVLKKPCWRTDN